MKIKNLEDLGSQKSLQNDLAEAENFWRQLWHNLTAPPPLTVAQNSGSLENQNPSDFKEQTYRLSMETTLLLHSLSEQYKLNIYTFLQAAWALMLHRYSGEEDIIFGINQQDTILPMRLQVVRSNSVLPWLQAIEQQSIAIAKYQHTPLSKIQEWSGLPAEMPLFESLLLWENCSSELYSYPLILIANLESELCLKIKYQQQRFDDATIARMLGHFKTLLEGIANLPWQSLLDLPMLTLEENHQLLIDLNQTKVDYPLQLCLHQLIEQQVEQTPDAIAVVFEDKQLTYQELNAKSNQLAGYLQSLGVKPETLVGVCLERSLEMPIALLGILKAGGAYVPLDPSYPPERLQFMLQDTQVSVLVTQQDLIKIIPEYQGEIISLETDWEKINLNSSENLAVSVIPENLAYAIYTSGSTGQPKGVLVEHKAICHELLWRKDTFQLTLQDRILQTIPLAFDPSVWQIFGTLISGSTLIVAPPEAHKDSAAIVRLVAKYQVTILDFVPSMLKIFLEEPGLENCSSLRHVFCGGEALPATLVEQFKNRLSATISNQYGPTEACIDTTFWHSDTGVCNSQIVPIGRPITNKQVYILDSYLQPVPIGVPGELYVGGSLARGYLNRPELTADRFISIPDFPDPILYQTGDLVRYLNNGDVEYLGRIDNQVKIRGVRIEIGEIEAQINQILGVRESLAIARPDLQGRQCLVAYIIPEINSEILTATSLRQALSQRLPAYMIPSYFVMLAELPKLPNGKINRRELPAPEWFSSNSDRPFQVPRNSIEQAIADIFAQIIGLERVSIEDNLFELGGHSLLATQIISRTSDTFGIELFVSDLFQNPSVAQMSAFIQQKNLNFQPKERINRRQDTDHLPLSFAQTRLWFLDQLEPGNPVYNETTTIRITGNLNLDFLEQTINEIVRRHEALRTTFKSVDGQPVQVILPSLTINLSIKELQQFPETDREFQAHKFTSQEAKQPFNLGCSPLLRATLLRLSENEHWLLLTMHHIVCDAWSMGIFFQEMAALYEAFLSGNPSPLTELSIQYPDFAIWQRQWLKGEVLQSQLDYWKQQLSGSLPTLQLPTDRPRPAVQNYRGASRSLVFSKKLTEALKTLCNQQGVTLFMTLLTAFKTLLYRYSGQEDIIVGSPIAGRNRIETENLIGFFLNSLVLRTNLGGNPTFEELLGRVRQVTLEAYAHQDLPFEQLVEELQPKRDLSRNPFFDVMVNCINTPHRNLTLPELNLSFQERTEAESKFDLTLYIEERFSQLHLQLVYQRQLFDADRMACLLNQLEFLLEQIVANPTQPIGSYSLFTPQAASLLPDPSAILPQPRYEPIVNTFMSWAKSTPDKAAVCQASNTWTYKKLAESAENIARTLLGISSVEKEVVAVTGPRSFGLIANMMGVLLSRKILLTIDRNLPKERQRLMLEQAKVKFLLYVGNLRSEDEWMQQELSVEIIFIDSDRGKIFGEEIRSSDQDTARTPTAINLPEIALEDPAYIFFTSGTTGIPKGVLGSHQGLSHFLSWQRETFNVGPHDRTGQLTGLSFDVVLRDIFLPLTSGATLCLPSEQEDLTPTSILPWLDREKISLLHTVPSLAQSWLVNVPPGVSLRTLRLVFFAGEPLTETLIQQWRKAFPEAGEIINLYGPTETTLAKCFYRVPANVLPGVQPVGQPICHTQVLILGENDRLCGIGEPGQIAIRTFFRSLGYINASTENQQRFVKNTFREDPTDLFYYTGDRGRYRTDGSVEILGRIDRQVKIRGIRIEPGEIEAVLDRNPSVRQSVVIVREDVPGDKRLVAYVVPHQPTITINELRRYLLQQLPEYMVPSAFAILETLPLTPNGKIDRKALPANDLVRQEQEETLVAPRNELEIKLTKIWETVLDIQPIGVRNNFFDLGGHSLLALRLFAQIEKTFGKHLPVASIFQAPTVEQQAALLHSSGWSGSWSSLVALQPSGTKEPFFWVPPPACTVLKYVDLVRHLEPDRPSYGLQPRGLDGKQAPLDRIEDIAAEYLKEIQTLQPKGPYFLGGKCAFGCFVAFEMAQQIRAQGQEVAMLALLDPRHEIFMNFNYRNSNADRSLSSPNSMESLSPRKSTNFYVRRFVYLWRRSEFFLHLLKKIQKKIILLFNPEARYVELVNKAHLNAIWHYKPQVYPGKITIFQNSHRASKPEYKQWDWVATKGLEFYTISGSHKTVLEEPDVQSLAAKLKELLENF